jgi:hypothetical protein
MQPRGAHTSDWHSGNPRIRPAAWLVAFLCVVVLYIAAAALLGSFVNGDGSPYLKSAERTSEHRAA